MERFFKYVWSFIPRSKSSNHGETEKNETSSDLQPDFEHENCNSEKEECKQQLSDAVKEKSNLLDDSGPLSVYETPLKEEQINVKGCRCYSFGEESIKKQQHRTIMVLGATGAGKSTLINGMINYILGVEWECPYRFKLVREDPSKSQAESQTSEVTVYKINHQEGFKIDYSVTIIDTPGFGDTRGIERDKEITEQLRNLFSSKRGVSEINAVCFVAQASLARLTPSQKYVFDSVLSIFGKDIAENIRVLVTFADGQRPPVLEAINTAGVPCPKTKTGLPSHFKFNNSALFANNKSSTADSKSEDDEEGSFDEMFWNMGTKSMKRFFNALNQIKAKSLTMTKEVLWKRKQLENSVEKLQEQVKIGLAKLEEIKETAEQLKEHEAEISRNENFEFEITVKKPVQVDISRSGKYLTNCQQCHFTCHANCSRADDKDKHKCCAMGPDGHCKVCPGKCFWNVHFNQKYKWEYKEVKEKQTVTELKKKYDVAKGAKSPVEALIGKLTAEYNVVQEEVEELIERSAECLTTLREIALRPNPLSTPEYIDMLIEGEKSEAKPGWKKRVQSLMDIREKALTMGKLVSGEKLLQSPPADLTKCYQDQPKNNSNTRRDQDQNDTTIGPTKNQDTAETLSNKNLNISSDANRDKTGIRTDQDKSEPNSDKTKPDSESSQHSDLDSNKDKTESTNPDQDQGDHDTNNYHIGNNNTEDQDMGNLTTDNIQDTDPDTDQDQDEGNCDADNSQDTDPDTDQDQYEGNCDADNSQDSDPDTDQDQDKNTCDTDNSQGSDPDADQDQDEGNCDTNNSQDSDPKNDQDKDQGNLNTDNSQDTDPDTDQDQDKSTCDTDNSQDSDPDADQDQDEGNCDADNSQDSDPDTDQDQDKSTCDAGNSQDSSDTNKNSDS